MKVRQFSTLVSLATLCLTAVSMAQNNPSDMNKPMMDHGMMMMSPLMKKIGGIHKLAAGAYNCIAMETKDEMLMANDTFKMETTQVPVPVMQFALASYLANIAGGQDVPFIDIAAYDKTLNLTDEQRAHAWEIREAAFVKAGVSKEAFAELKAAYLKKFDAATAMMPPAKETFSSPDSLHARLGGVAPISLVVNDFIDMLATDPVQLGNKGVVKALTDGHISAAGLKFLVTEQLAMASGGPFKYTGRSMADSHKGLAITEDQWASAAGLLKKVLDKYMVPEKEQNEVFGAVGATKADIVGK